MYGLYIHIYYIYICACVCVCVCVRARFGMKPRTGITCAWAQSVRGGVTMQCPLSFAKSLRRTTPVVCSTLSLVHSHKHHRENSSKYWVVCYTLSGPRFNIKMTSYQHRKCHCGDKTILRPSYLQNGISYTGKTTSLYWIKAQIHSQIHHLENSSKYPDLACNGQFESHGLCTDPGWELTFPVFTCISVILNYFIHQ